MSIIVGIDDSIQGTAAMQWGAQDAALRHTSLDLLHAFPWPLAGDDPRRLDLWDAAQRLVAEAEHWAKEITTDVRTEVVTDGPSHALIERSGDAELVVVGTRGYGGFHGLIVGSVALQVAGHASCPVALVGPETRTDAQEVIVGVGDRVADETLGAAFMEAALRGASLQALRAWRPSTAATAVDMAPLASTVRQREEQRVLGALAPWREKYPEVPVTVSVVAAAPRRALVDASARAALLVVGAREHHESLGLALGSVTHAVAHHAKCPVLIAR